MWTRLQAGRALQVGIDHHREQKRPLVIEAHEDYRRVLDNKDVDVVVIGTVDHWHSRIAIDAMRAGKDVYCEKPVTLTIREGQQILKVQQENRPRSAGRHAAADRIQQTFRHRSGHDAGESHW